METLGIARRTIQEWAQNGSLEWRMELVPGRKPQRLYRREQVERYREHGPPPRERADRPKREGVVLAHRPAPPPAQVVFPPEFGEALRAFTQHSGFASGTGDGLAIAPPIATPPIPLIEKLWLSIEEAAELSGLSQAFLRDLIVEREDYQPGENIVGLRGGPYGRWRILRKSLEAFEG